MPSTALGIGDVVVNKSHKISASLGITGTGLMTTKNVGNRALLFLNAVDRELGTEREDRQAQTAAASYLESEFSIN